MIVNNILIYIFCCWELSKMFLFGVNFLIFEVKVMMKGRVVLKNVLFFFLVVILLRNIFKFLKCYFGLKEFMVFFDWLWVSFWMLLLVFLKIFCKIVVRLFVFCIFFSLE